MGGQPVPAASPDLEAVLLAALTPVLAPTAVANVRPDGPAPYAHVVLFADLQGAATPISRYARVRVQGWSVRADGTADIAAARGLCVGALEAVQALSGTGVVLSAEIDAGPYRVTDSVVGVEYSYGVLLLEVSSL
jgi:hypothetical protein